MKYFMNSWNPSLTITKNETNHHVKLIVSSLPKVNNSWEHDKLSHIDKEDRGKAMREQIILNIWNKLFRYYFFQYITETGYTFSKIQNKRINIAFSSKCTKIKNLKKKIRYLKKIGTTWLKLNYEQQPCTHQLTIK